jgi:hypothetical protein
MRNRAKINRISTISTPGLEIEIRQALAIAITGKTPRESVSG